MRRHVLAGIASGAVALGVLIGVGGVYAVEKARSPTVLTPQDYIDIQQLYVKYAQAVSIGDPDAYAATFTPDGDIHVLQGERHITGSKAIAATALNFKRNPRRNRAWPAPPVITPAPDGARATCMFFSLDVSGKVPVFTYSGIYEDSLVKTSAGWRFKTRTFRHDELLPVQAEP